MKTYKHINWDGIDNLCNKITTQIKESNYIPDVIIGISRGGLIPARILCDKLQVSKLEVISVELYNKEHIKINPIISCNYDLIYNIINKNVLIVDDIYDSGTTINIILNMLINIKNKRVVTLFTHEICKEVDYFGEYIENKDIWVVYPWEEVEIS